MGGCLHEAAILTVALYYRIVVKQRFMDKCHRGMHASTTITITTESGG
jgi:hypothetical protein